MLYVFLSVWIKRLAKFKIEPLTMITMLQVMTNDYSLQWPDLSIAAWQGCGVEVTGGKWQ